jgi:hypothetical protein
MPTQRPEQKPTGQSDYANREQLLPAGCRQLGKNWFELFAIGA